MISCGNPISLSRSRAQSYELSPSIVCSFVYSQSNKLWVFGGSRVTRWLAYYSIFGLKEQWKFARKQKRTSCVLAYLLPFWQLFDHCRWRMNWGLFCKKTFKMYWPSRPRWIWPLDSTRLCTNSQPPTTLSLNRLSNKLAGSPSFVVMWGVSSSRGSEFESQHQILYGYF